MVESSASSLISARSCPVSTSLSETLQPISRATATAVPFKSPVIMMMRVPSDSIFRTASGTSLRTGSWKASTPTNSIPSVSETLFGSSCIRPKAIRRRPSELAFNIHSSIFFRFSSSIFALPSKISGAPMTVAPMTLFDTENLCDELNGMVIVEIPLSLK